MPVTHKLNTGANAVLLKKRKKNISAHSPCHQELYICRKFSRIRRVWYYYYHFTISPCIIDLSGNYDEWLAVSRDNFLIYSDLHTGLSVFRDTVYANERDKYGLQLFDLLYGNLNLETTRDYT